MNHVNGQDRILYLKIDGNYMPVGCLTGNTLDKNSEMLETTTRDNKGWKTSRPAMKDYSISFNGIQVNSTMAGGVFTVASYDKLNKLFNYSVLLEWKIQGTIFPVVDYGKCYISTLGEGNNVGEFMSFSGSLVGYGKPLIQDLGGVLLNNGDPNIIINSGDPDELIKVS
jgi:predicted secreted protein